MKPSSQCIDLIKTHEGCRLEAYLCPAGKWTIGYGHTGDVKEGMKISQHQAEVVLQHDLELFGQGVTRLVTGLNENQFSALVSFAFNFGLAALGRSTLLKKVQAGDFEGAGQEFGKWIYADGKKLPGLVKRREAERQLFMKPVSQT